MRLRMWMTMTMTMTLCAENALCRTSVSLLLVIISDTRVVSGQLRAIILDTGVVSGLVHGGLPSTRWDSSLSLG